MKLHSIFTAVEQQKENPKMSISKEWLLVDIVRKASWFLQRPLNDQLSWSVNWTSSSGSNISPFFQDTKSALKLHSHSSIARKTIKTQISPIIFICALRAGSREPLTLPSERVRFFFSFCFQVYVFSHYRETNYMKKRACSLLVICSLSKIRIEMEIIVPRTGKGKGAAHLIAMLK